MTFSEELGEQARAIWERIFAHPFIREAENGTLPIEKFRYYIIQDFHYLEGFGRTVAIALSKAPDTKAMRKLARRVNTPVERPLHVSMFSLLDITEEQALEAGPSPTNRAYVNHMITAASTGGVGEAAAALLPCPWTYHELGARLSIPQHPVYREWVGAYSSGLLEQSTAAWREMVDRCGAEAGPAARESMRKAFLTSSRYEYAFWDMAYRQERWPV